MIISFAELMNFSSSMKMFVLGSFVIIYSIFFPKIRMISVPLVPIKKLILTKGFLYVYNQMELLRREYDIESFHLEKGLVYHQTTSKGNIMIKCPICKKTSSIDKWTVFYHLHHPDELYIQIIKAVSEGVGIRSMSRIFDIDKDTVGRYIDRAAQQCRRLHKCFLRDLEIEECQLDEMWSFVYKKEKQLKELEKSQKGLGDTWIWIAFDAVNKIIIANEIGKRTQLSALKLIKTVKERMKEDVIPFFTSDNLDYYEDAILYFYGKGEKVGRRLFIKPRPDLDYAKVCKQREDGRVVEIKIEVCFGDKDRILDRLKKSETSNHVNIAFVERQNLTRRLNNRRLTRKTLGFSKKIERHIDVFEIEAALYHFCKPHKSLALKNQSGKNMKRTPFMAAGLTDHIWSVKDLLTFTPSH